MADDTTILRIEDAVNETCPWSGNPIAADSLMTYRGHVVGFCNTGCREKFARAVAAFDAAIESPAPAPAKDVA